MARKTKEKKYARQAILLQEKCRAFAEAGCVNVTNASTILDAECYALKKKRDKAEELYSRAVVDAARSECDRSRHIALSSLFVMTYFLTTPFLFVLV